VPPERQSINICCVPFGPAVRRSSDRRTPVGSNFAYTYREPSLSSSGAPRPVSYATAVITDGNSCLFADFLRHPFVMTAGVVATFNGATYFVFMSYSDVM
jgi:hypothetical protein